MLTYNQLHSSHHAYSNWTVAYSELGLCFRHLLIPRKYHRHLARGPPHQVSWLDVISDQALFPAHPELLPGSTHTRLGRHHRKDWCMTLLISLNFPWRSRFRQSLLTDKQFNKNNQDSGNETPETQFHHNSGSLLINHLSLHVGLLYRVKAASKCTEQRGALPTLLLYWANG